MNERRPGGAVALADAARGARPPASGTTPAHGRAPLPARRSLLWTPRRRRGPAPEPASEGPYELFLRQPVLRGIGAHVGGSEREARFGFLLGRLYRCPETGVHFAVCDAGLPSAEPFSEDAPNAFLLRAWAARQEEFRRHGGVLVGWYHSHYLLGLFLSETDLEADRRYFHEPWQCSVLVVPDARRPLGAVFRPGPDGEETPEPSHFRELLEAPDASPPRTAVGWTNYEADREAEAEDPAEWPPVDGETRVFGALAGTGPAEKAGSPGRDAAPGEGRRPPPRPPHAATPPGPGMVLADDSSERLYPRYVRPWLTRPWVLAAIAAVVVVLFLGLRALLREEPARAPARSDIPAPTRPVPEGDRFGTLATELDRELQRYEERARDFDLGRIGCDLLERGYAAADDAFVALASAWARSQTARDSARAAEYDRLAAEMDAVNRHFDSAGCQRPR